MKSYYFYAISNYVENTLSNSDAAKLYNWNFNIDPVNKRKSIDLEEREELIRDMVSFYEEWFDDYENLNVKHIRSIIDSQMECA